MSAADSKAGDAWTPSVRSAWVLACPQEEWREICPSGCRHITPPSPIQVNAPVPCTPHHSLLALGLGQPQLGKRHNRGLPLSEIMDTYTGKHWTTASTQAPFASSLLPCIRAKVPVKGEGNTYTYWEQSQLETDPQGFHSSNLGADPAPDRVVIVTKQRGGPASTLSRV